MKPTAKQPEAQQQPPGTLTTAEVMQAAADGNKEVLEQVFNGLEVQRREHLATANKIAGKMELIADLIANVEEVKKEE